MINQIIKNCEDEEIQFLNEIQPFGYLIGIHKNSHQIEFFSQNIDELFKISTEKILSQHINQLHDFELDFDEVLNLEQGEFYRTNTKVNSKTYHLTVYHFDELIYLELEELIILENRLAYYNFSEQILYSKSISSTWDRLISSIKSLIHYERVMLYKFLEDGSGVVIAEESDKGLDSYMGLRFPEFDIPKQARQLYLKKKSRLVADV
ncbi:MAG TPA: hypothetical protein DEG63_07465, partial [Flavobacteriaceae bacterium]|nr:hypothetical protein [Flavobacteriaceae bacterium]